MHNSISTRLRAYMSELRVDLKASKEQLEIYRQIRKGTMIYAEFMYIYAARSGVGEWLLSYKPAILKYKDWTYCNEGFALEFDVIASEDPVPYNSPYQPEYSGKKAQIRGPKYYVSKKIQVVPVNKLPLYVSYYHKTEQFEELLKSGT